MHFIGNFAFDIDGDSARGRVACINPMVLPKAEGSAGEGETMFFGLWYLDRYRRTADGWRIVERVEKRSLAYNMPEVRSEESRVGKESVRTCRARWTAYH